MKLNKRGFSLIELMVVVGIISILAVVAPSIFASFTFKSREAEAKTALAGLYAAQKSFHAQFAFYHTSFDAIGFAPLGNVHYNVGFGQALPPGFGVAYGFTAIVDETGISSRTHCGGIGGANRPGNRCNLVNLTPVLNPGLTASQNNFFVGAIINRGLYVTENDPDISKEFRLASSLFRVINALTPTEAHASSMNPGWVRSLGFLSNLPVGHEIWIMSESKEMIKFTGP